MKIIITGGAGFIGSNLARELVERGETVKIIDNLASSTLSNIADVRKDIAFKKGDARDYDFLLKEFRGYDAVLHHAALTSVAESVKHPKIYHDVNATGTLAVLEAAAKRGIEKVVFASSCAVYGDKSARTRNKNKETDAVSPLTPYALTKVVSEQYCSLFHLRYGLKTIIFRYFNVYGPGQSARSSYASVIQSFLKHQASKTRPIIYGDGNQTRDFVFIDDVVRANVLALASRKNIYGSPINIGTGTGSSINDLLALMQTFNPPLRAPVRKPIPPGDIRNSEADVRKAKKLLGYTPSVSLREGLAKYQGSVII